MKVYTVLCIVLCVISPNLADEESSNSESEDSDDSFMEDSNHIKYLRHPVYFKSTLSSEETAEVTETCCTHGESFAMIAKQVKECVNIHPPEEIDSDQTVVCLAALRSCCEQHFKQKDECSDGMRYAAAKRCGVPKTDIGKTCCEECSFGKLTGESQGKEGCGGPANEYVSPTSALRKNAYYQCCLEAAAKPPETTTQKKIETTTIKRERCRPDSCDHLCNDEDGKIRCSCNEGYRLQKDKKSCKDINECAEAIDDLCTVEGTVCHNIPGSFKCVPIKKREINGFSCPPGFKPNLVNQVCDDINECQLPRPPCAKPICENTIGGYKCAGKPGKPLQDPASVQPLAPTPRTTETTPAMKNDICPPGFRAGEDDECIDIDECTEHLDDCQPLSQYCINTHGHFFCQDHVSKRCFPGFKVNAATGICEDIDECVESPEVCQRNEVCVNMAGAYTCKSKPNAYPSYPSLPSTKTCEEGTRLKPGTNVCEDIDECVEGTHLCDQYQDCYNTYGGHECRCKSGFELDSSEACVDIDECALKLDTCPPGTYCLNSLGSYKCARASLRTTAAPAPAPAPSPMPPYEYEYYYSDEDNSTTDNETNPRPAPTTTSTKRTTTSTQRPTTLTQRPTPRTTTSTTLRPTTSTTRRPSSPPTRPPYIPRTSTRKPYTNRPRTTSTTTIPPPPELPRRPDLEPVDVPSPPVRPEYRPSPKPEPERPSRPEYRPASQPPERPDSQNGPEDDRDRRPDSRLDVRPNRPETPYGAPDSPERPYLRPERPGSRQESRPATSDNDVNLNDLHCLPGYEKNAQGYCVDINECESNTHICSEEEVCENRPGGYICECKSGYRRDGGGFCTRIPSTTTTIRRTTSTTTIAPPRAATDWTPFSSRTDSVRPEVRPRYPPNCDFGYSYDQNVGRCVDVDECATNRASCSSNEDCINSPGGYNCVCGSRCREAYQPTYACIPTSSSCACIPKSCACIPKSCACIPKKSCVVPPPSPPSYDPNVITVGSQYGRQGPRTLRPSTTRLPNTGSIVKSCPWGYKLTSGQMCVDIDECAKNMTECSPEQRCENFYGGYSCQCPTGHKLVEQNRCEDIDECTYGQPCPYNSKCVNVPGTYRCDCDSGFRNADSNDKICADIDECSETPSVCEQGCANSWGGYRCYCHRGYRIHSDNRTCVDVDECAEWGSVRLRGRLCGGQCVNTAGSYRCSCPAGYRLSDDGRTCIDIDECETGEASCAHGPPSVVCQNTRGSYHCYNIECPRGYRLDTKHKCTRIQRSCPVSDWECLHQPSSYNYNFITFTSNVNLPHGSVDLFTMHGPAWVDSTVNFEMRMLSANAPTGVRPMDLNCFDMRQMNNVCVVSLLCSPEGPQVGELELTMSLHQRGMFAGSAVARLVVIVSQYEF